jgi:hypothetical protein
MHIRIQNVKGQPLFVKKSKEPAFENDDTEAKSKRLKRERSQNETELKIGRQQYGR